MKNVKFGVHYILIKAYIIATWMGEFSFSFNKLYLKYVFFFLRQFPIHDQVRQLNLINMKQILFLFEGLRDLFPLNTGLSLEFCCLST